MRILYISSANGMGGGSSVALFNIVREMIARGHEVKVVTAMDQGPLLEEFHNIGCPYQQLSVRNNIYPRSWNPILFLPRLLLMLWSNIKAKAGLRRVIQEFRPDIVHTNVGTMNIAVSLCQHRKIPHIWHQREYQDLDFNCHFFPTINHFMQQSHSKGNYNICITKGIFQYRKFREGIDRVIYDGVFPQQKTSNIQVAEKQKYVLFVGRVEPAKGTLDLVRVFVTFHSMHPDYRLVIAGAIGDRKYYVKCTEIVENTGLKDYVDFLGNRTDVYSLMTNASMLVVPSRFEGFGFITAEAMLNFCPVVGRNTGGTKEQFDRGLEYFNEEIGLRFNNDTEMLERMCQVVETDLTPMCHKAREMVTTFYTSEYCVNQIEEYYRFVLENSKQV